jgi:hypothetical protein
VYVNAHVYDLVPLIVVYVKAPVNRHVDVIAVYAPVIVVYAPYLIVVNASYLIAVNAPDLIAVNAPYLIALNALCLIAVNAPYLIAVYALYLIAATAMLNMLIAVNAPLSDCCVCPLVLLPFVCCSPLFLL